MPTACRSPLMTSGTRPFIADMAVISRSCCASHPDCQYGLASPGQLAVVAEHVGIPLAPFAGAPSRRIRRRVHQMRHVGRRRAREQPLLDFADRGTPRSVRRASSCGARRRAALRPAGRSAACRSSLTRRPRSPDRSPRAARAAASHRAGTRGNTSAASPAPAAT